MTVNISNFKKKKQVMFLSEKSIDICRQLSLAYQLPWGELSSITDQKERMIRTSRLEYIGVKGLRLPPKPNGFRTLLFCDVMNKFLHENNHGLFDKSFHWFRSSFHEDWFQIYQLEIDKEAGSIGHGSDGRVVYNYDDYRHTAQALNVYFSIMKNRHFEGFDSHRILSKLINKQQKDGAWVFHLHGSEKEYSTMSCIELLHTINTNKIFGDQLEYKKEFDYEKNLQLGKDYIKNNLTKGKLSEFFHRSVIVNRILDAFKNDHDYQMLKLKLRDYYTEKWDSSRLLFPVENNLDGKPKHGDEIEWNALAYAAFTKVASFDNKRDLEILDSLSLLLNNSFENLADNIRNSSETFFHDATCYLFALSGHLALSERLKAKPLQVLFNQIYEAELFSKSREFILTEALYSKLMTILALAKSDVLPNENRNHLIRVYGQHVKQLIEVLQEIISSDEQYQIFEKLKVQLDRANISGIKIIISEHLKSLERSTKSKRNKTLQNVLVHILRYIYYDTFRAFVGLPPI